MNIGIALVIVGAIVVAIGAVSWKTGGRGAVFAGVAIIGLALFVEGRILGDGGMYAALVVPSALVVLAFLYIRTPWRSRGPELLLAGGAVLAIVGSQVLGEQGSILSRGLAVLAAILGTAFIAAASVRLRRVLRGSSPPMT